MIKRLTLLFAAALSLSAHAEPKKLLVVTVTTGFRHSSIETAEKVLAELGQKSGAFTVDYVHQPEGQPKNPGKPPERDAKKDTDESFKAKQDAYSKALAEFNEANKAWNEKITAYMADKMALDKIKGYDGFIFANTTGDLLLPDREGFIKLIEGGKAFVAMHSGSDTYHPFRGYIDMLGGEFETHKSQVEIQPIVHDPAHLITKTVPSGWKVFDEIYIIKTFDKAKVHGLLGLNTHPNLEQLRAEAAQRKEKNIEDPKKDADLKDVEAQKGRYYPVSWCKELGSGRVYYNSLGHREDVWDPTWKAGTKDRKNSPEIAQTYQDMILSGIKWALKLADAPSPAGNIP